MAGLANPNYLTLSEVAQMCHNQEIVPMVDEIGKATRLFSEMRWRQASDAMRDVTGKVTKYPDTKWVGLDLGAKASKGAWTQVSEGLAQLESWSEINEKTYDVSPQKDRVRWENDSCISARWAWMQRQVSSTATRWQIRHSRSASWPD